jgi:hypothetical protein
VITTKGKSYRMRKRRDHGGHVHGICARDDAIVKSPMEAVEHSQNEFPTAPAGPQRLVYRAEKNRSMVINRHRITAPQVAHFSSGVLV